jgi:hypothetical protein
MANIIHCIYASKASPDFDERELPRLLEVARVNNAARGVTGMLLYIERNFFQVLEGEEAAVEAIFSRLAIDPRHDRVTRIIHEPIFERDFPDWTMGYARAGFAQVKQHVGENDFFTSATCLEELSAGRARKLLSAFRDGRWRSDATGLHRAHSRVG